MKIHRVIGYEAAPEAVYAMLTSEQFLRRRTEASHALSANVSVGRTAAGTASTEVRQSLPADVPEFVRKLTGPSIDLEESIEWDEPAPDRSRAGVLRLDVPVPPVSLAGTITLALSGNGCTRQVVQGELTASVPVIGGKIERAAEPAVLAGLDKLEELGHEWLRS